MLSVLGYAAIEDPLTEHVWRQFDPVGIDAFEDLGADAAGLEAALGVAVVIHPDLLKAKHILEAYSITLHTRDLGNTDHATLPADHPSHLDKHVQS